MALDARIDLLAARIAAEIKSVRSSVPSGPDGRLYVIAEGAAKPNGSRSSDWLIEVGNLKTQYYVWNTAGAGSWTLSRTHGNVPSGGTAGQFLVKVTASNYDLAWGDQAVQTGSYTDPEVVRDTMADALKAGSNISLVVNDSGDTITISATDTNTTDPEVVRDTIAASLVAGANITIDVNDAGDTITISSTGGGSSTALPWEAVPFAYPGNLVVKTGASRYPIKGGTYSVQSVAAMLGTAPAGSGVTVDVNKNGTSIYTTQANRPTFSIGSTSAAVGAHAATTLTDGDYLTVDVDSVGGSTSGSDLTVVIRLRRDS